MFSSAQSLNHHSDYRTAINQLRSHPHHFFKSPAKRRLSHQHLEHHHASGAERVFVQVAYDFDYVGEDGGQVVMRENEILLLINKTNHDWWQVIRRGDRRPFYAPAKYVVELRPEDIELASATAEVASNQRGMQYRRPSPTQLRGFSTFQARRNDIAKSVEHLDDQSASLSLRFRHQKPPSSPVKRFSERYRSNSLDSILVSDTNNPAPFKEAPPPGVAALPGARHSTVGTVLHLHPPQHHLIPKQSQNSLFGSFLPAAELPKSGIQKRPTFDSLDKRKSWSVDLSTGSGSVSRNPKLISPTGSQTSSFARPSDDGKAADITEDTVTARKSTDKTYQKDKVDFKKRKPVPLPRSKVPPAIKKQPQQPTPTERTTGSRLFWKRSKTDLGADAVAAYKANKAKYPAPKVPTFNRPIGEEVKPKVVEKVAAIKSPAPHTQTPKKPKPEVKVKPTFSTFKQDGKGGKEAKPTKAAKPSVPTKKSVKPKLDNEKVMDNKKTELLQTPNPKSEPLQITTEPINLNCISSAAANSSSSEAMSESADKSCSTSFDSMEDSILNQQDDKTQSPSSSLTMKSPVSTASRSPPSPSTKMTPSRQVLPDWDEYEDSTTGRKFYYNTLTKEKSWKPPRKSKTASECGNGSVNHSPQPSSIKTIEDGKDDDDDDETPIPSGYERKTDGDSVYFVNIFTGVRWYSAKDDAGKTYFYEENGNESCWSLPNVSQTIQDSASRCSEDEIESPTEEEKVEVREKEIQIRPKPKTDSQFKRYTLPVSSPNIQIGNISIVVVKQGPLNKTKLVENGKKHRKSWSSCHLVLTDTFLLFFKDSKTFAALQSGSGNSNVKPDHNVDLKGAEIKWSSPEKSRRNNVFEVATLLGMTMLLQDDNLQNAGEWFKEISDVIGKINQKTLPPTPSLAHMRPMSQDSPRGSLVKGDTSTLPPSKKDAKNKVNRTKSLKMKFLGSSEELEEEPEGLPSTPTTPGVAGVQSKANIRDRLLKFFLRRPAMEDLFKKGIMKNEPVFGSTLKDLQATDLSDVPLFVTKCIGEIEKGERLKADGVYRQSGNLCTIQRIRLQVDQGNLGILETMDDDVHVLTGALKLFFRELKEPLIPWEFVNKLLLAANHQSKKKKVEQMKNLISKMPSAHKATLAYLLRHLVKVTHFKDKNRMQFSNLAIVFGPTLMWPPPQLVSYNLALDMMQQNIIVEALLTNVEHIF